jgi:GNAT superfamily N-acetyltransferase
VEAKVVTAGPELEDVRRLFLEYAHWVGVDLSFQGFAEELAELPGAYAAPDGTRLLCTLDAAPAGCVGVQRWRHELCEMKRLYVRPDFQGRGCGLFLARRAIEWATARGYTHMLLDTLPSMAAAQRLYVRLGFRDAAPYRFNPVRGARFMALGLSGQAGPATPDAPLLRPRGAAGAD